MKGLILFHTVILWVFVVSVTAVSGAEEKSHADIATSDETPAAQTVNIREEAIRLNREARQAIDVLWPRLVKQEELLGTFKTLDTPWDQISQLKKELSQDSDRVARLLLRVAKILRGQDRIWLVQRVFETAVAEAKDSFERRPTETNKRKYEKALADQKIFLTQKQEVSSDPKVKLDGKVVESMKKNFNELTKLQFGGVREFPGFALEASAGYGNDLEYIAEIRYKRSILDAAEELFSKNK